MQHDVDWLSFTVGPTGTVQGEIASTHGCTMPVYLAGECGDLQLLQVVDVPPVLPAMFTVEAAPGQEIWLALQTAVMDPPCDGFTPQEYEYVLRLWGLELPVAVEGMSWTTVKRLYR